MKRTLRYVRLSRRQQQSPSPPHLACPLLAEPFLVPWRANQPTAAQTVAACAPTLRTHSSRTGSWAEPCGSPRVHSAVAREPHVGFSSKQKHLLQPCPLWAEWRAPGSARRVAMASVAASPVGLHCFDVADEVLGQADAKDLEDRGQVREGPPGGQTARDSVRLCRATVVPGEGRCPRRPLPQQSGCPAATFQTGPRSLWCE